MYHPFGHPGMVDGLGANAYSVSRALSMVATPLLAMAGRVVVVVLVVVLAAVVVGGGGGVGVRVVGLDKPYYSSPRHGSAWLARLGRVRSGLRRRGCGRLPVPTLPRG